MSGAQGTQDPTRIEDAMRLENVGEGRFIGRNLAPGEHDENPRTVVFGGQLLGQVIAAALAVVPDKHPASAQVVFSRPATTSLPLDIETVVVQDGRAVATVTVLVKQRDKVMCSAIVTLDAGDEDIIRHSSPAPSVTPPEGTASVDWAEVGSELRIVDDVDFVTTEATGEPRLDAWVRFPDAPDDQAANRALLSWYTDMFIMGSTMRPHDGVGFSVAHSLISTGVLTHSIVFHEPWDVRRWFLVTQESTYAGRGRYYGNGQIRGEDGTLIASFSQHGLIRRMPERPGGAVDHRTAM